MMDHSRGYLTTKAMMNSHLIIKLKRDIRKHARERWFLLRLKSKYAGLCNYTSIYIRSYMRIAYSTCMVVILSIYIHWNSILNWWTHSNVWES